MKQDFLFKLTGRVTDFVDPLLNHGAAATAIPGNVPLRRWLGLLDTKTDVHVRALLTAAAAYPEDSGIRNLHVPPDWIYPELFDIVGAELVGTGKTPPMNCHAPETFPFAVDWEFKYQGPSEAVLIRNGKRTTVPVLPNTTTLAVSWPTDTGLFGNLRLHQAWAAGASITLHVPPRSYPYAALMRQLFLRADAVNLMSATGVAEAAHACPNPVRAAALLVKALTI